MHGGRRTSRFRIASAHGIALAGVLVAIVAPWAGSAEPTVAAESVATAVQSRQAEFCLAGTTPSHLSTMFDGEPGGLVGADYQRAAELPDGRVLWLFQDGAVRAGPDTITIVHNVAMLQDGSCFVVLYGGTRQAPRPFLFADDTVRFERWFWPLDAEMGDDGLLHVFVAEMVERGEEYLTEVDPVGTRVAVFDPATDSIVATGLPGNASDDLYGWSITSDHRWTYLYAQCYRQFGYDLYVFTLAFDRSCSTRVTVGRVPARPSVGDPRVLGRGEMAARSGPGCAGDQNRRTAHQREPDRVRREQLLLGQQGGRLVGRHDLPLSRRAPGRTVRRVRPVVRTGQVRRLQLVLRDVDPRAAVAHPPANFVFGLSHNRWDGLVSSLYRPTYHTVPAPPLLAGGGTLPIAVEPEVDAVVVNVTSTRSEDRGHLILFPCDAERPLASALNHPAAVTTGNLVVVRPSADGRVCVFSRSTTDVVIDSFGAFDADDGFVPRPSPTRLVDTRDTGRVPAGGVLRVRVPAGLASAVFNVTSVMPDADGYVTAYPCDRERPVAANVNHRVGAVVGNLVMVRVGATGEVCLYAKTATDLVVDLAGGFVAAGSLTAEDPPRRLLDTRDRARPLAGGDILRVPVPEGAGAVVLNLAAVDAAADGFATAYDCDGDRPGVSSLNYAAGSVRSNLVVVQVGASAEICVFTRSSTHLVVDLAGVFAVDSFVPASDPVRLVDTRLGLGS